MRKIKPKSLEDKILAAISHFFNVIVAIIVWAVQKDKSKYVRFQAIQAAAYHILISIINAIIFTVAFAYIFTIIFKSESLVIREDSLWKIASPFLLYILVLWLTRLIATICVLRGKDFRYPWLGKRVEKFLNNK
ncbi:MAG: DUF4870 domain-containing protein [Anaerolineales bacterium]|nr:DUF4870 domain-containing protein [Anaerolineales bacterium]